MTEHYDVIIIGTGAGGGTLAHTLAASGKRILLLERGDFLPREMENWEPEPVFVDGRYISDDTWYDADGKPFQPQVHYFVGGATKLYGAALYRLRPAGLRRAPATSTASRRPGRSPTTTSSRTTRRPSGSTRCTATTARTRPRVTGRKQYPWPAVSHEPRIQQLSDDLQAAGYHPFHAPCGILLDEADRPRSHVHPVHVVRRLPVPGARQVRRRDDRRAPDPRPAERHAARRRRGRRSSRPTPSGGAVTGVVVVAGRQPRRSTTADIVVVSAGASNSAKLLLRLGERPPPERARQRLRPGRPQLHVPQQQGGRRAREGARTTPSSRRRSGINDFYFGADDYDVARSATSRWSASRTPRR